MKILFACLAALLSISVYAQPLPEFAPLGAKWIWNMTVPQSGGTTASTYSVVSVIGVDTLKGKACKKLQFSTTYNDNFFFYRDSLIIYAYDSLPGNPANSKWRVLYDFTKTAGESYYAWVPPQNSIPDSILVNVQKRSDTLINGFTLPYMIIQGPYYMHGLTILNIGCQRYFIPIK